jgi:hypothetical protein
MNIDNHDHEISFVILGSQPEVQWLVAMTVLLHVHLSLLLSSACFGHLVLTNSICVNRMATKLEANVRNMLDMNACHP